MFVHHPNINPTIFSLGPLAVRWYGLMYVIGYLQGIGILKWLIQKGDLKLTKEQLDKLILYLIIGMFIGSRTAYVFIYNWDYYKLDLFRALKVWEGGLSFHGAVFGMFIAILTSSYIFKIKKSQLLDACALAGAPGVFWGRIGNFINGELYGRVTNHPFGMIFRDPEAGNMPRHPSQLYEAFGEGVFVFLILLFTYFYMKKKNIKLEGLLAFLYVGTYGLVRFLIEYTREPDSTLGFFFGWITMGQMLCTLMMIIGFGGIAVLVSRKKI